MKLRVTYMKTRKGLLIKLSAVIAIVALAVLSLALITFIQAPQVSYAGTLSNTVSASATVSSVCYITLTPTSINFGSIASGANVLTNVQVTDNDINGNAAANVLIGGGTGPVSPYNGVWVSGGNSFGIANTLFSGASQASYTGTAVTNTLTLTTIYVGAPTQASPFVANSIYFGLNIPGGTAAGSYTTNIVIENSC